MSSCVIIAVTVVSTKSCISAFTTKHTYVRRGAGWEKLQHLQPQGTQGGVSLSEAQNSASDSSSDDDDTPPPKSPYWKKGKRRGGADRDRVLAPSIPQDPSRMEIIESSRLYFSNPSIRRKSTPAALATPYTLALPTPPTEWRTQAKLTVHRLSTFGSRGCRFGLHIGRHTGTIIPIPDPTVHHPAINRAIEVLEKATKNVATSAFLPETGQGGLRYVQVQVERSSGKVCLTLVWNADCVKRCQPGLTRLVKEMRKIDPDLFRNVWLHTNDSLGESMFARGEQRWHRLYGPEYIREHIPGYEELDADYTDTASSEQKQPKDGLLHYTPMVFRHANIEGFGTIAQKVSDNIPTGSKVCELYAGVGILGLTALKDKSLQWLRCSDENAPSKRCFYRAVNSMPTELTGIKPRSKNKKSKPYKKHINNGDDDIPLEELMELMKDPSLSKANKKKKSEEKATYQVASASKALQSGQALGANVLIVDPPRKGLDDTVLEQLCRPYNPNQEYAEDIETLNSNYSGGPRYTINYVNDVRTLVYVSGGFDSLARDCDVLLKGEAGWMLESATGYVLFPGSNHVQTLVVFKRCIYWEKVQM